MKTQNEFSWWNSIQWQLHYLQTYSQLQNTTHIELYYLTRRRTKSQVRKRANENIKYITEVCWLCGFVDKVLLVLLREEYFLSASIYQLVILWNTALQSKVQGCVRWAVREAHLTQIAVATLFLLIEVDLFAWLYYIWKRKERVGFEFS